MTDRPATPRARLKRICCNPNCGWTGDESECVYPKHWPEDRLCPECYEVTEEISEAGPDAATAEQQELI